MKKLVIATSAFISSLAPALLIGGQITTECQNQAKEYAVQPELVSQYVKDCIVSMGGEAPSAAQALGGADANDRSNSEGIADDSDAVTQPGATAIQ